MDKKGNIKENTKLILVVTDTGALTAEGRFLPFSSSTDRVSFYMGSVPNLVLCRKKCFVSYLRLVSILGVFYLIAHIGFCQSWANFKCHGTIEMLKCLKPAQQCRPLTAKFSCWNSFQSSTARESNSILTVFMHLEVLLDVFHLRRHICCRM